MVFDEGTEEEALERQRNTELTAFFELNAKLSAEAGGQLDIQSLPTYVEMPQKYTYNKSKKEWIQRKAQSVDTVIGRVHGVNPLAGEAFYLRILLHTEHCKGKTSFQHLRTLPNGRVCDTYQEVCRELGLLTDDQEWERVLEESVSTRLCPQIRELYVAILMFCQPANPRSLFDEFWQTWTDDFEQRGRHRNMALDSDQLKTMVLLDLQLRLQSFEKELRDFGLPEPSPEELARVENITSTDPVVIREEKEYDVDNLVATVEDLVPKFTPAQAQLYDKVNTDR